MGILNAASKIQWNVAMMLEAKAVEAEKVRNWTLNHLHPRCYDDHEKQLSGPLKVHGQIIEVIEGITKLQTSLCSNLKVVLPQEESSSEDSGGMGGFFGEDGMGFGGPGK